MLFWGAIANLSKFLRYTEFSKVIFYLFARLGQSSCVSKLRKLFSPRKTTWQKIKTKALKVLLVMLVINAIVKYEWHTLTLGYQFQQYSFNLWSKFGIFPIFRKFEVLVNVWLWAKVRQKNLKIGWGHSLLPPTHPSRNKSFTIAIK